MSAKVSVITICYNAEKYIGETILSVTGQTYPHIEYIVVDGMSADRTMEILESHRKDIATVVSEKDSGIYDAMNKGLALATGDFVIFMNAGDIFYDAETVQKVFANGSEADIYYGEALYTDDDGRPLGLMSEIRNRRLPDQLDPRSMRFGMIVSHQSIFVRRSIAGRYDLRFRYSADIDWIIRALKLTDTTKNTQLIISRCRMGGYSQKHVRRSLKDRYSVLSSHYGIIPNAFNHLVILLKTLGKKRVKF